MNYGTRKILVYQHTVCTGEMKSWLRSEHLLYREILRYHIELVSGYYYLVTKYVKRYCDREVKLLAADQQLEILE